MQRFTRSPPLFLLPSSLLQTARELGSNGFPSAFVEGFNRQFGSLPHLQPGQIRSSSLLGTECVLGRTRISPPSETLLSTVLKRHFSSKWSRNQLGQFLRRTKAVKKITSLLFNRRWDEDTPDALNRLGVQLSSYVASEVLRSPIELETALKFFDWLKTKDDFDPDSYVYNTLICRLGSSRRYEEMEALAEECESDGKATVATFTSLIGSYKRAGNIKGATRTWRRMEETGVQPNLVTYTTMIDLFAKMKMYDEAGDYYLQMLQERHLPNIRTCTILIYHLVEAGKLDAAVTIFDELVRVKVKPNPVTYTTIMVGYARVGDLNAVLNLVKRFKDYGHRPRPLGDSFSALFKFLFHEGRIEDAERIMYEVWPQSSLKDRQLKISEFQAALERDSYDLNTSGDLISVAAETCSASEEEEEEESCIADRGGQNSSAAVQAVVDPSTMWNIVAFVKCLVPWTSVTAEILEHAKVKWDGQLVSEILKRLRKAGVAWKFFSWVRGQPGFNHDSFTYSRMIQLLLTDGDFTRIKGLLDEAQKQGLSFSLLTYNNIIKYCGLRRDADVALEVFDLIKKAGLKPDEFTYKNLIHTLYKCNRYWRAATIFSKMQRAISGFAAAGEMEMAKAVYRRMCAAGIQPNTHIYRAFISAFYDNGDLVIAERLFKRMKRAGITPSMEIYNLMIKVFKSIGKFEDAHKLEDESQAMICPQASGKKGDLSQFMHFHTIFLENVTSRDKAQSLAVG